ncbi:TPA: 50S ribosomal protein L5 [Patescibacteria group bacterium]|jgi:large subunit ribosomal protein L5|nr:50S ribosomal protein L5 [Patescibacteria group bacterium]|tara:strand:- start:7861 stop:8361 length:501 start_codon:yes stop_codon:yes gene_type:complete
MATDIKKQIKDKLEKVVVNVGVGKKAVSQSGFDSKILPEITKELSQLTGQKPATRVATKSIAGFKLRQGMVVGLKVTLRGKRMIDFVERLNKIVLPRLRDFRGLELKNVDQGGGLSIGLQDHLVFPEINPETSKANFGLQITLVPKVKDRESAIDFYRQIGVPLKK